MWLWPVAIITWVTNMVAKVPGIMVSTVIRQVLQPVRRPMPAV